MAYRANPFLERLSEKTSDQDFVQLFSPNVLERLDANCLASGIHLFKSPPGGGKTTILRAFTPQALRAFWNARATQDVSFKLLGDLGVFSEGQGPSLLGVQLSCAAGYSDLPPGTAGVDAGLFRALLDCRIVLRTLRSLALLVGGTADSPLEGISLSYDPDANLSLIPVSDSPSELAKWAVHQERRIYSQLEASDQDEAGTPNHPRFEGVLWLQAVTFRRGPDKLAPQRLLMIDDIQALRRSQRQLLLEEMINLRPAIPVWLAGRSIAFVDDFVAQGARVGRDFHEYALEDIWNSGRGGTSSAFQVFAQNVLDRRLQVQQTVPGGSFGQYLRDTFLPTELSRPVDVAEGAFRAGLQPHRDNERYREWLNEATTLAALRSFEGLIALYKTRVLIARDLGKRQLAFDLGPLSMEELEERESASVKVAAELFAHFQARLPFYYGIDRLCALATNNVEELLALAAALFEGMRAKLVLRRATDWQLTPSEQERRIKEAIAQKRDFIPKTHSEGTRAQKLLDSIGEYCRERTFLINAPYAPGVTGVRLSGSELELIRSASGATKMPLTALARVLVECIAENLLVERQSGASSNREGGTVFYLNRGLCAHYDLPLQYGGWQDVSAQRMIEWMDRGPQGRPISLEPS